MKKLFLAAAAVLVVCACAPVGAVTSDDVIKLLSRNSLGVKDYQADVTLTIKAPKISVKGMRMTLYYKQPGKTKVVAKEGMGFMPKQMVFQATIQDMVRQSKVTYLGEENKNSVACYLIKVEPKQEAAPPAPRNMPPGYRPPPQAQESVKMWVEKGTGAIIATSISSGFGAGSQANVVSNWKHQLVDNNYYMPAEISLDAKESYRGGGESMKVTVTFSGYKINRGIPDSVFKEEPTSQPSFHGKRRYHRGPPGPPPPPRPTPTPKAGKK